MNFLIAIMFAIFFFSVLLYAKNKFKHSKFIKQAFVIGVIALIIGMLSKLISNPVLAIIGQLIAFFACWVVVFGLDEYSKYKIPNIIFIISFFVLQVFGYAFGLIGVQLVIYENGKASGFAFASTILPLIIALISWQIIKKRIKTMN